MFEQLGQTDTDTTVHTVRAAVIVARGIGYSIGLAVLAAIWDALAPATLTLTPAHLGSWLLGLLSLIALVSGVKLVWLLVKTYTHLGEGGHQDRHARGVNRRRFNGTGRRHQAPGRHRKA